MGPFTNKKYKVIGEKKNKSMLQLEASIFGNVKVEPMILELNDSTNEDVQEVSNPNLTLLVSHQTPSQMLDIDISNVV